MKKLKKVSRTNSIETSWGGHGIFWMIFSGSTQRGPGQWCPNIDLLKDLNYVNYIKNSLEEFREYRIDFENTKDAAKHMVRSLTVVYSIQTKTRKQVERELQKVPIKEKKILRIF